MTLSCVKNIFAPKCVRASNKYYIIFLPIWYELSTSETKKFDDWFKFVGEFHRNFFFLSFNNFTYSKASVIYYLPYRKTKPNPLYILCGRDLKLPTRNPKLRFCVTFWIFYYSIREQLSKVARRTRIRTNCSIFVLFF